MAEIPRSSRRVIQSGAVAGAQIPFDIADTGQGIEAQGLKQLGQGLSRFAQAIGEIELRKQQANDINLSVRANIGRQGVKDDQAAFEIASPDPNTWDENLDRLWKGYDQEFSGLQFSGNSAQKQRLLSDAEKQHNINTGKLRSAGVSIDNSITSSGIAYVTAASNGQPDAGILRDQYEEALALKFTPEIAQGELDKSDARAKEAFTKNQISIVSGAAFGVWEATVTTDDPDGDLNKAFDLINASEIPDSEKQEAESELKTRVTNRRGEDKLALEASQEEARGEINQFMYIDKNYQATTDRILASTLGETEKGSLLKETETRAASAAKGAAETNDPVALDNANFAISKLGNGTITRKAAGEILTKNTPKLKSETADGLWKDLNKEFDASVDSASDNVRTNVRLRAIGKSESILETLIKALADKPDDKTKKVELQTARDTFNLELENFNRWETAQRAWKRDNSEAGPEEIEKEGLRSWYTDFANKTPDELKALSKANQESLSGGLGSNRTETDTGPVRMQSPDGRTGTIPADQVQRAIDAGWRKL